MDGLLKEKTRELLMASELSYTRLSKNSGVPYGALYHFATKGDDMSSVNMQKLYEYLSGKRLIYRADEMQQFLDESK